MRDKLFAKTAFNGTLAFLDEKARRACIHEGAEAIFSV